MTEDQLKTLRSGAPVPELDFEETVSALIEIIDSKVKGELIWVESSKNCVYYATGFSEPNMNQDHPFNYEIIESMIESSFELKYYGKRVTYFQTIDAAKECARLIEFG